MKLTEVSNTRLLKDKDSVSAWVRQHVYANSITKSRPFSFRVRDDLTVDVGDNAYILDDKLQHLKALPVKFGSIAGNFHTLLQSLQTLAGFPELVDDSVTIGHTRLTAVDFDRPISICRALTIDRAKIESLHDIHKVISSVQEINIVNNPISNSILGLMLIKDLRAVHVGLSKHTTIPLSMIQRYLPNKRGKEAMYEYQEELIEAGFEAFAKL